MPKTLSASRIEKTIRIIRNENVMLDRDLAELYQVETKALIQAVKRNPGRFPRDFMFQLEPKEFDTLRSHFVTSNRGGRRSRPYAFTEQGVAMLSSVLRSKRANEVNVEIIRTFVRLRGLVASHAELASKLRALEEKCDSRFGIVFEAIRKLMTPPEAGKKRPIGYIWDEK